MQFYLKIIITNRLVQDRCLTFVQKQDFKRFSKYYMLGVEQRNKIKIEVGLYWEGSINKKIPQAFFVERRKDFFDENQ